MVKVLTLHQKEDTTAMHCRGLSHLRRPRASLSSLGRGQDWWGSRSRVPSKMDKFLKKGKDTKGNPKTTDHVAKSERLPYLVSKHAALYQYIIVSCVIWFCFSSHCMSAESPDKYLMWLRPCMNDFLTLYVYSTLFLFFWHLLAFFL